MLGTKWAINLANCNYLAGFRNPLRLAIKLYMEKEGSVQWINGLNTETLPSFCIKPAHHSWLVAYKWISCWWWIWEYLWKIFLPSPCYSFYFKEMAEGFTFQLGAFRDVPRKRVSSIMLSIFFFKSVQFCGLLMNIHEFSQTCMQLQGPNNSTKQCDHKLPGLEYLRAWIVYAGNGRLQNMSLPTRIIFCGFFNSRKLHAHNPCSIYSSFLQPLTQHIEFRKSKQLESCRSTSHEFSPNESPSVITLNWQTIPL